MSRKSVLLSRLGCGFVFLLGMFFALDAWAGLSFSPSSVTGTIHYSPASPALSITSPTAATVNSASQTLVGSLSTAGNLSINGVNVPLNPDHSFSYPVTLTEGTNTFAFLGVDLGGNRVTLTKTITLDTMAPSAPNGVLISVIAASGQATFTGLVGSTDPNTQITITNLTTGVTVSVTSDGSTGAFNATLPGPFQTGDQVTLIATNQAGNASSATTLIITLDTTPPSTPNTGLISASLVGSDGKTTITGAAGAVDPSTQVTITDQNGGASVTFTSDLGGAFPPGEELTAHAGDALKITVTDEVGNISIAMIQVPGPDTTPPVVMVSGTPPQYTTQSTYTFTGTVSEPATLYLYPMAPAPRIAVPVKPDLTFSYTVTLQQGLNGFSFQAIDNAGNQNTVIESFNINFDNIPPIITITSAQYTGQPNYTLAGAASEIATVTVNGTPVGISYTDFVGYAFSVPMTLVAGENDIAVTAVDLAGNTTTVTAPVYLNTGALTFTVTSASLVNYNNYTLTGQLTKEGSVIINGSPATVNPDLSFSYPVTLVEGSNTFDVIATDMSNNNVSQTATITLDSTSPTITVITPQGPYANQANLTLTGNLSEASTFTINDIPVTVNPDLSFSYPLPLIEGENDFNLMAIDPANNQTYLSWSINLDTAPPVINFPLLGATDNGDGTANFSGTDGAIDNSPNRNDEVDVTVSGVANGQSATTTVNYSGGFGVNLLASAEDPFNITAVDGAGNVSSMRVQLGTVCYADGFATHNAMLTVGAGSGTVIGPQGSTAVFHVTRTGELGYDTYVDYQTADGDADGDTAVAGQDYTSEAGSVKIPAGASSANITIPLLGGSTNGPDKTFTLQILSTHNPIMGASGNGGGFAVRDSHPVGNSPWFATTADINGDGKPDVLVANNNPDANGQNTVDGTVSVLLNTTPDGATQESLAAQQAVTAGLGTSSVAVADVNGDGKPDLVVTNQVDNNVMVFLNTTPAGSSTVSFTAPLILPTGTLPESVAVADLNGDGKPDIVVGNDAPDNTVTVYLNTTPTDATSASFTAQTFPVGSGAKWNVVIADVNGDGLPDVIMTNDGVAGDGSDSSVAVLLNTTATGASTPSFAPQQQYPVAGYVSSVAVADLNGDGVPDLAATSENQNAVVVMTNQTPPGAMTLSFAPLQTLAVGSSTDSLAAADLDGDGKIDLVVANTGGITVSVLHNKTAVGAAAPSFGTPIVYGSGNSPWPVLVADLNSDSKPDIISVDEGDNTVSVLMNHIGDTGYVDYGSCVMPDSVIGTVHYGLVPPVITVISPTGTSFESPYQVLSGSVSGAATLTVNGANVPLNADGTFSMNITLQMGVNTYLLTATSAIGVPATQTLTLTLNSPSLPAPGASGGVKFTGGAGQVTITGTAPAGATGVTVIDLTNGNSNSGLVDASGSYSATLTGNLSDSFSVTFTGSGGAQSAPVYVQGNDPTLSFNVTSPCSGAACNGTVTVNGNTVNIGGSYSGPVDMGITVNGEPAQLSNGAFNANNLPLTAGLNTITIVATTSGGIKATQTLTLNSVGITDLVLKATPNDIGTAPFTVDFSYSFQGTATIQAVEMSYLGNGTNDVVSDNPADTMLSHIYSNLGVYTATLTLIDTNNVQYQAKLQVDVQDPSQVDAIIKKTWSKFAAALAGGDRATAMNYLDATARQNYAPVFDTLLKRLPAIASTLSPLLQSQINGNSAEYAVVRDQDGQSNLYFIEFVLDSDGVWRIESM